MTRLPTYLLFGMHVTGSWSNAHAHGIGKRESKMADVADVVADCSGLSWSELAAKLDLKSMDCKSSFGAGGTGLLSPVFILKD